ncbi:unnamed protein product [Ambrosiozyma monospora]|uniref:Unnamed protein product n=1 Tax=Ambrosiozyma monospora TaxID=43982 RepID=A0A9W6YU37_AMBMO|nr:unnamed protein product [Ambrosiozyma monospora]
MVVEVVERIGGPVDPCSRCSLNSSELAARWLSFVPQQFQIEDIAMHAASAVFQKRKGPIKVFGSGDGAVVGGCSTIVVTCCAGVACMPLGF